MGLRLYNTRTRKKEPFDAPADRPVRMYVCGPTTYDHSHLGHARSYVAFDTIRRYLEYRGHRVKFCTYVTRGPRYSRYRVTYVQNFTDIEEVIIRRAAVVGKAPLAY